MHSRSGKKRKRFCDKPWEWYCNEDYYYSEPVNFETTNFSNNNTDKSVQAKSCRKNKEKEDLLISSLLPQQNDCGDLKNSANNVGNKDSVEQRYNQPLLSPCCSKNVDSHNVKSSMATDEDYYVSGEENFHLPKISSLDATKQHSKHKKQRSLETQQSPRITENEKVPLNSVDVLQNAIRSLTDGELDFCETNGIYIKTGRFTDNENRQLERNWARVVRMYKERMGFCEEDVFQLLGIGCRRRSVEMADLLMKATPLYKELAYRLPNRTLLSIYQRARKVFDPTYQHVFTPEDDLKLLMLYDKYDKDWKAIGSEMDLTCYVRIRNRINQLTALHRPLGAFSKDETQELINAVAEMCNTTPQAVLELSVEDINWKHLASMFGNRRAWSVYRNHWALCVMPRHFEATSRKQKKFTNSAKLLLCEKLQNFHATNERSVDWTRVAEGIPNCNPHRARFQWSEMKKRFFLKDEKTFQRQVQKAISRLRLAQKISLVCRDPESSGEESDTSDVNMSETE